MWIRNLISCIGILTDPSAPHPHKNVFILSNKEKGQLFGEKNKILILILKDFNNLECINTPLASRNRNGQRGPKNYLKSFKDVSLKKN